MKDTKNKIKSVALIATIGIVLMMLMPLVSAAVSNNDIANIAIGYDGQYGDQCKEFIRTVIQDAGGPTIDSGYKDCYLKIGVEIQSSQAMWGDIIQTCNDSDSDKWYPGTHSAIVLENKGDNNFKVVDSNWNLDEIVHIDDRNLFSWASGHGTQIHYYRLGTTDHWDFNLPTYTQSWEMHNAEDYSVEDGKYFINPEQDNPWIQLDGLLLSTDNYNAIEINMASNCPDGNARIYFVTESSPSYDESKMVEFKVNNDGDWQTYTIYMANHNLWEETITGIRIDPAENGEPVITASDTVGFDWIKVIKTEQPKLDLIFLVDTTGSMWDDIDQVKASANEIVEALNSEELDYRIAIADYRDYPCCGWGEPTDYVYKLDLPFTTKDDKQDIIDAINNLVVDGGADTPESVYSALVHSMEDPNKDMTNSANSGWRNGVTKAIIIMGDAPPHIPEPWIGGHTLEDVISVSESIDPVIVYSIIIGSSESAYDAFAEISEGTNGKVYSSPTANDIVATIIEVIGDIGETPETRGVFLNITPSLSETMPGNSASYSVNITNMGNIADTYNVLLELENFGFQRGYPVAIQPSWVIFNSAEVTLDPGMSEVRSLTITVPENWAGMEDVIYGFDVTATSTTDTSIGNTSSAELKVKADKRSMIEYSKLEIQWLAELVEGADIDRGIKNSLLKKLTNAESKVDQALVNLDNGKIKTADNMLWASRNLVNAFANQIDAQYDKKIMQPDAIQLEERADQIMEDIEKARNS